jgi:cytochrome c biogenesis protein ResB
MLYKTFSSLKTSVYALAFLSLIFLIGTIFPQGENIEDYIKAGGKYITVVRALDFLDIFMSPIFLIAVAVLVVNLAVCLYDRFKVFTRIKRKPIEFERLREHPNVISFKGGNIEDRLKKAGFKFREQTHDAVHPGVKVYEKGLQFWWLSWFYHVGIILAIIGFFLTSLFAFEEYIVLYPDKEEMISLHSKDIRWNSLLEYFGLEAPEDMEKDKFILKLKEFRTEYYQGLKLDYPKGKLERLAIGIGAKQLGLFEKGFSYMPKMWLTRLEVKRPDGRILDGRISVNRPFRTKALTLYQMGYDQKITLDVNGETVEAEARVPFSVKGIKGEFVLGMLRLGTLFKKDGTEEEIKPVTELYRIPEEDPSGREKIGEVILGEAIKSNGVVIKFKDYREGSYLSYRKDPGVWLVGIASLFVFLGLIVRSLGAWYRVQVVLEKKLAYVLISSRGILADRDRIIRKLGL